ncbi:MAG TPA: metallophosphoesterase [Candidatus Obscuribacterales bacterium]
MSSGRRIFIGDVHGHYDGLMALFDAIAPASDDQIYFLGDLIDRGPKSCDVVEFVKQQNYTCIMGNHEHLLLEALIEEGVHPPALQAWLYSGGQSTVSSYKSVDHLLEHRNWIRTLPTHLDLGDIWLAHAGIHPGLPVAEQTTQELCWIRERFHSMTQPYFEDKLIIIGHTITFTLPGVNPGELAQGQGWLDIDTGAYHPKSGWLTGVDVDHHQVYQVNVFDQSTRTLPLHKAVTQIDPSKVLERRRHLMQL